MALAGIDFEALGFLWLAFVVPVYYMIKHVFKWVVKVRNNQHREHVLKLVKEFMESAEGQKILSDSFGATIEEVERDVGELATNVEEFTKNYYSKLESLIMTK